MKRGKRILICGGRDFKDRKLVYKTLDKYVEHYGTDLIIIHGDAPGADTFADEYAKSKRLATFRLPAQWHVYDNSAGPIRNRRMLKEAEPDEVLAFPGNKGTRDMMSIAKLADVKVSKIGW